MEVTLNLFHLFCILFFLRDFISGVTSSITSDTAKRGAGIALLMEFQAVLPQEHFAKMLQIYSDKTIPVLDREKLAVNYFSQLPDSLRKKLPVPIGFRRYPVKLQKDIHSIYYQDGIDFKTKLIRISDLVDKALKSTEQNKNSDVEATNSNVIEFQVNVTLKINGFYTKQQLENMLNEAEFSELTKIQTSTTLNAEKKKIQVGQLLKQVYNRHKQQNNIDRWPETSGLNKLRGTIKKISKENLFEDNLKDYERQNQHTTPRYMRHRRIFNTIKKRDVSVSVEDTRTDKELHLLDKDYVED